MINIAYFKRFRMEVDLNALPPAPPLPEGYCWLAWEASLLDAHAEAKFRSFCEEIDSVVFPSLSYLAGCQHLMREISGKHGFCPEATWLLVGPDGFDPGGTPIRSAGAGALAGASDWCGLFAPKEYCGTVQGVRERSGLGAIQNLGVTPAHRGRGLGRALLLQALHGFRRAGLGRAFLEVTAQNEGAIRLYRRLGFRCRKTLYKAVDTSEKDPRRAGAGGAAALEPAARLSL